jgi:hypothetical protein
MLKIVTFLAQDIVIGIYALATSDRGGDTGNAMFIKVAGATLCFGLIPVLNPCRGITDCLANPLTNTIPTSNI